MSTSFENDANKSPEMLEQEIDAKRQSIGNIVDSLENRFSPGQLIDQALSYTKGNGGQFFQNLGTALKNNPVPTALTGVGLAWLAMNQNKPFNPGSPSSGPGLGEKIGSALNQVTGAFSHAGDKLHSAADSAKAKGQRVMGEASNLTHRTASSLDASSSRLSDTAHDASYQLNTQASQLKAQLNHTMKEQPLVVAAIGMALGAVIGAALPPSRSENKLFGETRDEAVSKAKSMGAEVYSSVKENVKQPGNAVETSDDDRVAKTPEPNPASADLSRGLGIQS
ncbi:DUF3618 domain-containing protein [Pseudomonas seleniipraecipitans]|uniref:DUF3618 domain-containing protein n=1 Tax=Phytopseudomonas seleniipraecipitans TaxID=640205 RepID=A0ABY5JCE8_9GAMM|nr:DUF3618 domain-containing protein [Pseudomonas seleniipraecipitans]UUD64644.1 DUF3618 domain-containing protein [Pseudomonas seleniipraecipitans]